ncbi:ATP-binding protein [Novosphingobium colocasiae]|uniref:ATP-binding protein n=1 Tax=Novosphingobium colocasiae TaxID=1256513 RepID=UPI0035AFBB37
MDARLKAHTSERNAVLSNFRAPRFTVAVAAISIALVVVQLAASLLFYRAIDRQTLNDDHARRIAELLVVSDRTYVLAPGRVPEVMSTRYLQADIAPSPSVVSNVANRELNEISERIISWEPSLSERSLRLSRVTGMARRQDLVGSIRLSDGRWLNFRSRDITSMWPVASRAIAITLATSIALLAIGLATLHLLSAPLRKLTAAADQIGRGREVLVSEQGPRDLRDLSHAMNIMQARISRLLRDQTKSFEAISHDLRTPLSRQKIAAELLDDEELSEMLLDSVNEMDALLDSLQKFLRAQTLQASPEPVDLGALIRDAVAPFGDLVTLGEAGAITLTTYPEPLALTVQALVENAIQFGSRANIGIKRGKFRRCSIVIEDEGPGIPQEHFDEILDPFFRLDEARGRNTKGFGLGIPLAHRLMMRFDGGLDFDVASNGGLQVTITPPEPSNRQQAVILPAPSPPNA